VKVFDIVFLQFSFFPNEHLDCLKEPCNESGTREKN
jgi:hypothetical protein